MHGNKDGDEIEVDLTFEEFMNGDTLLNETGSYEIFQNGDIHGLRNRYEGTLKVQAVNEALLEDNKPNHGNGYDKHAYIFNGKAQHSIEKNGNKKLELDHHKNKEPLLIEDTCRLLRVEEMPDHLQFNTYVHTGYRDLQSAWDCLLSLFYLHNETVNILTHLIPIIGVLYYWRSMFPWDEVEGNLYFNFLGWSHIFGSITPWLGSVTYHLFMNHHKGPGFYKFLLQLDMLGIWITQAFGALTNLTASTWCLSDNSQQIWLGTYAIASAWGLHKAITAESALGRRMCFGLCFASRLVGFILRTSSYGGGDPNVLTHVILQDIVSILGGFIGVFRIPEAWFPGRLDLFFNSHHIMHVMVVMAVLHMNFATNGDVRWMLDNYSKAQCVTLI